MNRIKLRKRTIALICLVTATIVALSPLFGKAIRRISPSAQQPEIAYAIFDLGGVLMETNRKTAFVQIGITKLLRYIATLHNPRKIEEKLFQVLHEIRPLSPNAPKAYHPAGNILLPQILHDWLSGTYPVEQVRQEITTFIDERPDLFSGASECAVIRSLARMLFTPASMAKTQYPIKDGIAFVKKCKERGLTVFILSNFSAESFALVYEKHPELFSLFDEKNIFISAHMGTIKPDPAIYHTVLKTNNLDGAACVFF